MTIGALSMVAQNAGRSVQSSPQTLGAMAGTGVMVMAGHILAPAGPAVFVSLCQQLQQHIAVHQHGPKLALVAQSAAGFTAAILRLIVSFVCCGTWVPQMVLLTLGSWALCSKHQRQHWRRVKGAMRNWMPTSLMSLTRLLATHAPAAAAVLAASTTSKLGLALQQKILSSALLAMHTAMQNPVVVLLSMWALVELFYFLFIHRPKVLSWNKHCNAHSAPAAQNLSECHAGFKRFMDFTRSRPAGERCAACYAYLSTWFRGAALSDIQRGNMDELFAYGFFYRTRQQMDEVGLGHLPAEMTAEFESVFSLEFPPGYNSKLRFMSHLWDDLRVAWCPLAVYAVMECLGMFTAAYMAVMGFKRRHLGDLHYYTRGISDPTTSSSTTAQQQQQQPVVFIHGCMGLLLYLPLLHKMAAQNTPLLVVDMKHIALRMSSSIPTVDSLTAGLAAALRHHNLPPALVVAHSYGTLIAARLLRLHRDVVDRVLMVDPVCFGMFMPQLLHAFLYAPLRMKWNSVIDSAFNLLLWLITKDVHMAATFGRRFYWSDTNLWPEELPSGSVVLLSGHDVLMPAEDIHRMLSQQPDITVLLKPDLIHGGFLMSPSVMAEVCTSIKTLMQMAPLAAAAVATAAAAGAAEVLAGATAAVTTAAAAVAAAAAVVADDTCADLADGETDLSAVVAELKLLLPGKQQQKGFQTLDSGMQITDLCDLYRSSDQIAACAADDDCAAESAAVDLSVANSSLVSKSTTAALYSSSEERSCSSSLAALPGRRLTVGSCYPDWCSDSTGTSSRTGANRHSLEVAVADDLALRTVSPMPCAKESGDVCRRATVHAIAV